MRRTVLQGVVLVSFALALSLLVLLLEIRAERARDFFPPVDVAQ
jgi:hypothetical protein